MLTYIKLFALLTLLFFSAPLLAQHENDTWLFSNLGAIKFNNGASTVIPFTGSSSRQPFNEYISTCISDNKTGDLLYYIVNDGVYNATNTRKYTFFNNFTNNVLDRSLIIPSPGDSDVFYFFHHNEYCIINKSGGVISWYQYWNTTNSGRLTAIKHAYNNSYWLFYTPMYTIGEVWLYHLTETGISAPIIIPVGNKYPLPSKSLGNIWNVVPSSKGNKLLIQYLPDSTSNFQTVQLFDFDKICGIATAGIVINDKLSYKTYSNYCFSPDDSKIYETRNNTLVQYSGTNYQNIDTVITDTTGIVYSQMRLGPDNKIYVTEAPDFNIGVIEFPDSSAATCSYKTDYFNLNQKGVSVYNRTIVGGFPNLVYDYSTPGIGPDNPGLNIQISDIICVGDSSYFTILPPLLPDSVHWDFGDSLSGDNFSAAYSPSHLYNTKGKYTVTAYWYKCGNKITQPFEIEIKDLKVLTLGTDTFFCYNDSIVLSPGINGVKYTWSTGSTAPSITVKEPGKYWVWIKTSKCSVIDTITIKEIPPVMVDLGGDYSICDDDNELVLIDAGKGYNHYKWTPTGDTSQWIIVSKIGNYFVVVEDFRGCKGGDGSVVSHLCDYTFYIPNAFTPNGDGRNDVFAPTFSDVYDYNIELYNRWGELVFSSDNVEKGWDGTYKNQPSPEGIYAWRLRFKGYQNKLLRNYNYKGTVTLMR